MSEHPSSPIGYVSFSSEVMDEEEAAHDDPWFREIEEVDIYIAAFAIERERQLEHESIQAFPVEEDEAQRLMRRASVASNLDAVEETLIDGDDDRDSGLSDDDDDDDDELPPLVLRPLQDGEDDDSTCASGASSSDFLDCLDPSKAEYMVGAQTVDEINERFGDRLPQNWLDQLSYDIRHVYSEPDQGKGQHDGEAGVCKKLCYNGELSGTRSPNATGVFLTLTERLGQKLGIKRIGKFHKYLERKDPRLLKIELGTITNRVYLLFLEDPLPVLKLRDEGFAHAHYIERKKPVVDGADTVKGTDDFKEVFFPKHQLKAKEGVFELWSSTLACSCNLCMKIFNHPARIANSNTCGKQRNMR